MIGVKRRSSARQPTPSLTENGRAKVTAIAQASPLNQRMIVALLESFSLAELAWIAGEATSQLGRRLDAAA